MKKRRQTYNKNKNKSLPKNYKNPMNKKKYRKMKNPIQKYLQIKLNRNAIK